MIVEDQSLFIDNALTILLDTQSRLKLEANDAISLLSSKISFSFLNSFANSPSMILANFSEMFVNYDIVKLTKFTYDDTQTIVNRMVPISVLHFVLFAQIFPKAMKFAVKNQNKITENYNQILKFLTFEHFCKSIGIEVDDDVKSNKLLVEKLVNERISKKNSQLGVYFSLLGEEKKFNVFYNYLKFGGDSLKDSINNDEEELTSLKWACSKGIKKFIKEYILPTQKTKDFFTHTDLLDKVNVNNNNVIIFIKKHLMKVNSKTSIFKKATLFYKLMQMIILVGNNSETMSSLINICRIVFWKIVTFMIEDDRLYLIIQFSIKFQSIVAKILNDQLPYYLDNVEVLSTIKEFSYLEHYFKLLSDCNSFKTKKQFPESPLQCIIYLVSNEVYWRSNIFLMTKIKLLRKIFIGLSRSYSKLNIKERILLINTVFEQIPTSSIGESVLNELLEGLKFEAIFNILAFVTDAEGVNVIQQIVGNESTSSIFGFNNIDPDKLAKLSLSIYAQGNDIDSTASIFPYLLFEKPGIEVFDKKIFDPMMANVRRTQYKVKNSSNSLIYRFLALSDFPIHSMLYKMFFTVKSSSINHLDDFLVILLYYVIIACELDDVAKELNGILNNGEFPSRRLIMRSLSILRGWTRSLPSDHPFHKKFISLMSKIDHSSLLLNLKLFELNVQYLYEFELKACMPNYKLTKEQVRDLHRASKKVFRDFESIDINRVMRNIFPASQDFNVEQSHLVKRLNFPEERKVAIKKVNLSQKIDDQNETEELNKVLVNFSQSLTLHEESAYLKCKTSDILNANSGLESGMTIFELKIKLDSEQFTDDSAAFDALRCICQTYAIILTDKNCTESIISDFEECRYLFKKNLICSLTNYTCFGEVDSFYLRFLVIFLRVDRFFTLASDNNFDELQIYIEEKCLHFENRETEYELLIIFRHLTSLHIKLEMLYYSITLELAKRNFKTGHLLTAQNFLLSIESREEKMENLRPKFLRLFARILINQGRIPSAIKLLKKSSVGADLHDLVKANVHSLLAESQLYSVQTIHSRFKDSINSNKISYEKLHFCYAKFLEINFNIEIEDLLLTADQYLSALVAGNRYLLQTLPKAFRAIQSIDEKLSSDKIKDKSQGITNKLKKMIDTYSTKIPAYKCVVHLQMLISRIMAGFPYVEEFATRLLITIAKAYPEQAIWWLCPLYSFDLTQKSIRAEKAKNICSSLPTSQKEVIDHGFELIRVLAELATKKKSPTPVSMKLTSIRKLGVKILLPVTRMLSPMFPKGKCKDGFNPFPIDPLYFSEILPNFETMPSKEQPIKICVIDQHYNRHFFLLKNENHDVRRESRIIEFANYLNSIFSENSITRDFDFKYKVFSIISITQNVNIVEWIPNTRTVKTIIKLTEEEPDRIKWVDHKSLYYSEAFWNSKGPHKQGLRRFIVEKRATAKVWFENSINFTKSCAIWTAFCYVIRLGDRHLENILINIDTCELSHIDFECIFDKGKLLPAPEVVDFRLTPALTCALGVFDTWGLFFYYFECAMQVLKENLEDIIGALDTFVLDPIASKDKSVIKELVGIESIRKYMNELMSGDVKKKIEALFIKNKHIDTLKLMYYGWSPQF